jgi:ribonuclease D
VRPEDAWKRLAGTQPLTDAANQRLQSLAFWRESSAQKFNLPRAWIVKDEVLLQIALSNVRDPQLFTPIRGLKARSQQELSESFREMLSKLPPLDQAFEANLATHLQRDPERKRLMQDLSAIVRQTATELDIPASLLASRRDLDVLLDNPEKCRVLRGWRLPIIGQRLQAATHGFSPGYP